MTTLACRLIKASNLAYDIKEDGTGFDLPVADYTTMSNVIGFIGTPPAIYVSKNEDGIDACYFVETLNEWLLVFRGTLAPNVSLTDPNAMLRSLLDWLNDAKIAQTKGDKLPGLVHTGFLKSLDNLWKNIDPSLFTKANQSGKPLYITGHSKGGGLAFLAAQRLLAEQVIIGGVYTFAAPRAGNQAFALTYDAKLRDKTYRFEYQDDMVPHIPPHTGSWLQYIQSGQQISGKISETLPPGSTDAKSAFDALNNRLQTILKRMTDHSIALESYVSVGTLKFIDWGNNDPLQDDSWGLTVKRELHLAELFLTFKFATIVKDHFSSPGYGYMDFQYPEIL